MRPETKLINAIFQPWSWQRTNWIPFTDEDITASARDTILALLDELSETGGPHFRERVKRVIIDRFGFNGESKTLQKLGDEFGIARETIRQIEAKALRMLRHPSRRRRLESFLTQSKLEKAQI